MALGTGIIVMQNVALPLQEEQRPLITSTGVKVNHGPIYNPYYSSFQPGLPLFKSSFVT